MLVFGSVNVDLVFAVSRLPRPGETVLTEGFETVPGGKGANQAVAAARAGAHVRFAGRVGADANGDMMRDVLAREAIDTCALARSQRPTGIAVIGVEASGENSIIVASGANLDARAADVDDATLASAGLVLCQNEVPTAETLALLARARAQGAATLLNVAPVGGLEVTALGDVDVLILNEHEAAALAGGALPESAAARLAEGGRRVVVTLGAEGALGVADGRRFKVPSLPVRVVDTTGAGDTFCGVLAATLAAGRSFEAAVARAAVVASLACEALGAQAAMPRAAVIEARLGAASKA